MICATKWNFDCTSFRSTKNICTLARYCLFALRSSTTPRSGISSNYLDFILRSKISLADRQISLRVLLCTRQGRVVGVGCCGGKRQALSKKVATYLSFVLRHAEVSLPEKCKPTYNCQQVVSVAAILPKSTCPKSEKDYEQGVNLLWRHWFAKK